MRKIFIAQCVKLFAFYIALRIFENIAWSIGSSKDEIINVKPDIASVGKPEIINEDERIKIIAVHYIGLASILQ